LWAVSVLLEEVGEGASASGEELIGNFASFSSLIF
jgi:hypothetical protein